MSLDVPYERLGTATKVDYIPLKLALTDLPETNTGGAAAANNDDDNAKNNSDSNLQPKIDINLKSSGRDQQQQQQPQSKQQFYDALVLGLLTFFCILVLLYAIYYFVILRDRQKSTIKPSYMF
ncbi:hypothetical protein [Spodoptera cosmioides nucleopolyhedrovirus]|uniref:Ac78-like protein n=1 Tax=Spodoptera cosmioides nucleopolyhedrovirus TaxID=2605774 RepID=A0A6B7KTB8_9ABAC|nr:hypothetical protein [Spodoptera cosmioides nucleopolyhedrovirus]